MFEGVVVGLILKSQQEFDQHFPKGPDSLEELFNWHVYNATELMKDKKVKQSFIDLVCRADHIVLHEDYAGMGTCGVSLAAQFRAMRSAVADELPTSLSTSHSPPFPFLLFKQSNL